MLSVTLSIALLVGIAGELHAQVRATLPAGVSGVSFGTAQRYKDASGKEMCAIVQPLPEPVAFPRGVTEISYGVHLQPLAVKSASAQIVAPGSQAPLQRTSCDAFTLVKGGFSQTQLGSTISRGDKSPLRSGKYILRLTVDGQSADLPFIVE